MTTEQQEKRDPEKEYRDLLKAEVKSTRMSWDDFKRAWKKDRRFFAFGRDDRQREKAFRAYQKELGERRSGSAGTVRGLLIAVSFQANGQTPREQSRTLLSCCKSKVMSQQIPNGPK